MKRVLCVLVALLPTCVCAQNTPNLNLQLPVYGSAGWGTRMNQNFLALDGFLSGVTPLPQVTLSGAITNANQAATKAYVDAAVSGGGGGGGNATALQTTPISATPPTSGQFLSFNGTAWIPSTVSASNATSIQGVGVAATAPSSGQVLSYNGSQYVPQTIGAGTYLPLSGGTVTGPIIGPAFVNSYNVLSFGALCDGSHDDSTAIQSAVTAAETASSTASGIVLIPAGNNCKFNSTITVTGNGILIEGIAPKWNSGHGGSGLIYGGTGDAFLVQNGAPTAYTYVVSFKNLSFKASAAAASFIHFHGINGPSYVANNNFDGTGTATSAVIYDTPFAGLQTVLSDNYFQGFSGNEVIARAYNNILIQRNQFFSTNVAGLYLTNPVAEVSGNYFELMPIGIEIGNDDPNHFQVNIHDNTFNNGQAPPAGSPVHTSAQRCILVKSTSNAQPFYGQGSISHNQCDLSVHSGSITQGLAPYGIEFATLGNTANVNQNWELIDDSIFGTTTSGIANDRTAVTVKYQDVNAATVWTTGSPAPTALPVTSGSGTFVNLATLPPNGVTAGSYASANITVDATGRVTSASNGTGGGGGLAYSSPSLTFIPVVSNIAGSGTVVNSAFSDDGFATHDTEPFGMFAPMYMQPTATATSGSNFFSNTLQYVVSYWNGSTAVNTQWGIGATVGTGTNPATTLGFYAPPDLATDFVLFATSPSLLATSAVNRNTPKVQVAGATWNGTVSQPDIWNIQGVQGAGSNPTSTLTFTHSGSSGVASVQLPSTTIISGAPGINNNGAQWTGGTSLPATCNVSDTFSLTNAASLSTTYQRCFPANTWNPISASGGGAMTATPTFVVDSGTGTSPSGVSMNAASTDGGGWIGFTSGTTPPANSGVITIKFGGSYSVAPKCGVEGANAATQALSGATRPFVPPGTSTTAQFVWNSGITGLAAGTAYLFHWWCTQ